MVSEEQVVLAVFVVSFVLILSEYERYYEYG